MKRDKLFSWQTLLLILAGLAINLFGAKLVLALNIPIFLDSAGTILISALGGSLPGVLVGFFSNYINSIDDPITLYYGIVSIIFAFIASDFSRRGIFKSFGKTMASALLFSLIGGGLGSVITWTLYGFNFGTGISAPYAIFLNNNTSLGLFWSQFIADMGIDLLDKVITLAIIYLILKLLPDSLLAYFPYGEVYKKKAKKNILSYGKKNGDPAEEKDEADYGFRSVRNKILFLIIMTSVILSSISIYISYTIYSETVNQRFMQEGRNAANLMRNELDAELINHYLADDTYRVGYEDTEQRLQKIKDAIPDIKYMYVYRILEDGCHVVFDLDTPDTPGGELGDVVEFDKTFSQYLPQLLAGEEIPPVVSNDQFGALMTTYEPIYDYQGNTVAYAGVDVSVERIQSERATYLMRLISLLLGASMIIISFSLWFAQKQLVLPINSLASATSHFSYENAADRKDNLERLNQLDIHTRDEIEKLYDTLTKSTQDMSRYIELIDEKTSDLVKQSAMISHLQDNIILSFANLVENRDENTGSHVKHTAAYVRAISEELLRENYRPEIMTPAYILNLTKSAPLHDIGKIKVPDTILNKPGKLTDEEFAVIKQHTTKGRGILLNVFVGIEENNYLSEAIDMATYHHEKWNGSGYPAGLVGEDIPLCARIMAIADVFDALVSRRSYKAPMPLDKAFSIIEEGAGTHFDPRLVEAFLKIRGQISAIVEEDY